MEPLLHNDYRQHPILSDEGLEQYRAYLARLEAMIVDQEDLVSQARAAGEDAHLARERTRLWRLLTQRHGVLDAISAYERQRTGGTAASQATAAAGSDAAEGL
jgi:hypothetical protein